MNQFNARVTHPKSHMTIISLKKIGSLAIIPLTALIALGFLFGALWVDSSAAAPSAPEGPILYVAVSGITASNCTVANPCTLAYALEWAEDGDEIRVAAGTYTSDSDPVLSITTDITVTGGFSADDNWTTYDPVANATILDAEENGRVINVVGGSDAIIQGFDIRNGSVVDGGGGILVQNAATAIIRNNRIHDNIADNAYGGGGIFLIGNGVINDNDIYNNASISGGGIRIGDSTNSTNGISKSEAVGL